MRSSKYNPHWRKRPGDQSKTDLDVGMNVPDTTISVLKMIKENAFIGKKEKKVVKDIK